MARILVVDDEEHLRDALRRVCERDGHEVTTAGTGAEAIELARSLRPDLIVLDNRMPGMTGLDALARIRESDPEVAVLMYTAVDEAADVRRAIVDLGAYGYLVKGAKNPVEQARASIVQALASRGIAAPRPRPAPRDAAQPAAGRDFGALVGRSGAMRDLYDLVRRIGHSDVTVLIQGESGTGKELVARAIHDHSRRHDRVYVTVDCGTLPDTLAESEIFGYEAGAFTDARKAKPGKMEMADGGTLFLDEVGNLSFSAQAKLLRVLEDRRVTRLGGQHVHEVDVRIIAATNVDLAQAARDKAFREDLFYRLNVFMIWLPPLRDRREDIPLLVEHFVRRFAAEQGRAEMPPVSVEAMARLESHAWPGNVRELRNVLERAVLLCEGEIRAEHLPQLGAAAAPDTAVVAPPSEPGRAAPPSDALVLPSVDLDRIPLKEAKRRAGEVVERAYLVAALRRSRWNKSKAARLLGLNYKTLREKIAEHQLERAEFDR